MRYVFLIIFLFIVICPAMGQEEKEEGEFEYKTVIRRVDGINFDIPEDRPIEKKDGIVVPMELDKYVALKFSRLEERLAKIEHTIQKIKEELDLVKEALSP